MHAASLIMLSWVMIGAACFVSPTSTTLVAGVLAVMVAVIGLPHGAVDHRFARPRLESAFGMAWLGVFLISYLSIAAVVVCGWQVAPAVTITLFFLASAWHFGQEEPRFSVGPRTLRPAFRFARGGLVIWVPVVFQTNVVLQILTVAAPRGFEADIQRALAAITFCAWPLLALAMVGWVWQCHVAVSATGRTRRVLVLDNSFTASMTLLFATANPIVGFLVYFCGWHSIRGLSRLRRELGETWSQLVMSVAPMTITAIGLIAVAAVVVLRTPTLGDTLIRVTFVGLSAVAVPHVLLHGAISFVERLGDLCITPVRLGSSA
jgi:Brp/Blh family beta-carotene 15,15'-monooxygenase